MYKQIFSIIALLAVMYAHGAKAECACSKNHGTKATLSQYYDKFFAYDADMSTELPTR